MDDTNYLKIIANPLKLNKIKGSYNKIKNKDHFLYDYLENKYKGIYIHHTLFYNIIESIDSIIIEHVTNSIVNDIVETICNKFDKTVINNITD